VLTQRTSFAMLNQTLKRLHAHQAELLLVLDRPDIPLHTNGSENDIRGHVKWRKISGGTRRERGRRCRDAFASLKKTCRKLGISCWDYLPDRLGQIGAIPPCRISSVNEPWRHPPCRELLSSYPSPSFTRRTGPGSTGTTMSLACAS
jgi:hypothetical protein